MPAKRTGWFLSSLLVVFVGLVPLGCVTPRTQLERVAKDWCLVIRASQVIPVYPLTEDLQPGDVFLVQTPVEKQADIYEEKGFLPLEQMLVRLPQKAYPAFYNASHGIGDKANTPHHWKFPAEAKKLTDWPSAPMAAFPTYSFTIKRGLGLNMAVPVKGVPIALTLLGADSAHCTMTLDDAFTYGLDTLTLERQVRDWGSLPHNRNFLRSFGPEEEAHFFGVKKKQFYLRIVARVYLIKSINASIMTDEASSLGISVGVPKPVAVPDAQLGQTAENYKEMIKKLNEAMAEANKPATVVEGVQAVAPGGTIKIVSASSRSISLRNEFGRPLVVGYVGFDLPIEEDGNLAARIPTGDIVSKGREAMRGRFVAAKAIARPALARIYSALTKRKDAGDKRAAALVARLDRLGAEVPDVLDFRKYWEDDKLNCLRSEGPTPIAESGYWKINTYWSELQASVDVLGNFAVRGLPFSRYDDAGKKAVPADEAYLAGLRAELARQQEKLAGLAQRLAASTAIINAVDYYNDVLKGLSETDE